MILPRHFAVLGAALLVAGAAGAQVAPAAPQLAPNGAAPQAKATTGPSAAVRIAGNVLPGRAALHGRLSTLGSTFEDFESYSITSGNAENLNVLAMDETTIANGQGPGLVEDGCTYSCAGGSLQWNGPGWFGQPSKDFLANSGDGRLRLDYSPAVDSVGFDMLAFDGFSDSTVVTVYDGGGALIFTSSPTAVPGASPVFFGYAAPSIGAVEIQSLVWPWSTLIDNHEYGGGGLSLSVSGTCPGPMTASVSGATPGGRVAFAYSFSTGSVAIPPGYPCVGTVLGLGAPVTLAGIETADGSGNASLGGGVPAGACGSVFVQALDIATCTPTNVVGI